ncbi:ELWxxDGT repeat protein [Caulifigura coniformis]|nr:ELWxxDGT repeat protein [Caulifigura coniformis]
MASWIQRTLGLRPRFKRIRRRKIAGLSRGAMAGQVVHLEPRVLPAGTPTQITDANSNTQFQNASSNPTEFTDVGSLTFFTYNTTVTDKPVLGFTNGAVSGTTFVDVRFSPGTRLTNLTEYNGALYFFANGVETIGGQLQSRGMELWKHDPVAGTTTLVKDIVGSVPNPHTTTGIQQNEGSNGAELIVVSGKLYFTASDDITGQGGNRELWVSDGTETGTNKVHEIYADGESSNPTQLTNVNDVLYFVATGGPATGRELWKFNPATDAIPVLVKDIRLGLPDSGIDNLTPVGNVVYFSANDGVHGNELWKSDGTEAGTVLVQDVWSGVQSSNPQSFVNLNGVLFFSADDGNVGRELWKSDPNEAQPTVIVRDIAQVGPNGTTDFKQNSIPHNLTAFNGKVYFAANDGLTGDELWVTDGTFLGTHRIVDLNTELTSSGDSTKSAYPGSLTVMNGALYFIATNTFSQFGETNFELYRMQANEAVNLVRQINTLPSFWQTGPATPTTPEFPNGQQFFKSNGDAFLATSPTFSPIGPRTNFSNNQLFVSNNRLYFAADNGINGATGIQNSQFNTFGAYTPNFEIWSSDGSAASTIQLADLTVPQTLSSSPLNLTTVQQTASTARVYFTYLDPNTGRFNLAYTQTASSGSAGAEPGRQGTTYDVGVSFASNITNPVAMGGKLYFFASDSQRGNELWVSDGTVSGTTVVQDVFAGTTGSSGAQLVATTNRLFWVAQSSAGNLELWSSDGTVGNATALTNIGGTPNIQDLTVVGTRVYFAATDPTPATGTLPAIQRRLWFSDGTAANTRIVVSTAAQAVPANPTGPFGPLNPTNLVSLNGQLFFSAGNTIYRTNGTDAGTIPLPSLPGSLTGISNLTAVEDSDRLYFTADDGTNGVELWTSNFDGNAVQLVSNIHLTASSNPQNLTAVGTSLYFTADNGTIGRELYRASGTSAALVADINPGAASSSISNLIAGGTTTLFFSANDGVNGAELWSASGLSATLLSNINPSVGGSSSPASFAFASNQVYFAANDGVNGRELWRNGGPNGATLVRDIGLLTTGNADIRNFVVLGGNVYYLATTGPNVSALFRTSSSSGATEVVTFSDGRTLVDQNIANTLVNSWAANGRYLAHDLVVMGGNLYLAGATGASDANGLFGTELYRIVNPTSTNPLPSATLLGDIRLASTGNPNAVPTFLTVLGNQILFAANDGVNGTELWTSSGGAPTLLLNIDGGAGDSNPRYLQTIGNRVYFTAGPANARTAYVTDGTAAGTIQLSTAIVDERNGDGEIFRLSGNRVFFSANGGQGFELWSTNGTAAGTSQVRDIRAGAAGSDITGMISYNGILYFGANDGIKGSELWRSDGTAAGTFLVKDIEEGPGSSNPSGFAIANNSTLNNDAMANGTPTLLFAATTDDHGRELYQTRGLEQDTVIVKDIAPGRRSSNPTNLTSIDGTIYFAADDGVSGNTLWRSVGVDEVTQNSLTVRVKTDGNLAAAPNVLGTDDTSGLRNPDQFTLLTLSSNTLTRLFFSASSDAGRNEAYELDINHTPMALTLSPGQLAENLPIGAVAGTLETFDPDAGDTFQYTFVQGTGDTDNALFEIVGNSLQARGPLDFEDKNSYTVRVRTTDQRGQFLERALTISVADVNDKPDGLSVENPVTTLPELTTTPPLTTVERLLGTMKADDDAFQTTNKYVLSGADAAHFEVRQDLLTGVWSLYLRAGVELNYETNPDGFTFNISIYDETLGATAASPDATIPFTLALTDVNENPVGPISDDDPAAEIFNETVAPNTPVGITAKAIDPDGTSTITYSLDVNPDGLFQIDPVTGVVSTALALNRESPNRPTHTLRVRATSSDGSFSVRDFVITVNDVDEADATPIVDNDAAVDAVTENLPAGTTVGVTAFSVDADATTSAITYSLDNSAGGLFAINPTTGVVTTTAVLDRESVPGGSYGIVVRATSQDGSAQTKAFTIAVNDVDEFDVTPIVDTNPAADAVDENSPIGTSVGITANSVDADATTSTVTYSLVDSAGGLFQINPSTGVVTTAAVINRESPAIGSYNITVQATSQDTSTTTQTFTIVINDIDESDLTPIVDTNAAVDAVDENVPIGTAVGITANSVDGDATNSTVTYTLDNSAGGLFQINSSTGVITTAALINRESPLVGSYNITVRATSQDSSTTTKDFTIVINDVDEFDVTPIVDTNLGVDAVDENAPIGTAVGVTANSVDADATTSTVTYTLDDDAGGLFQINPSTGVVTTAALINRESPLIGSYSITVRATSQDTSTTTKSFTIVINDVDEFDVTPIVDTNAAANSLSENSPVGTLVGITAHSIDADATTSTVTYTLDDNAGGLFQINPSTGVVTTAALINRESPLTGAYDITIRATSLDGSTEIQTYTIAINDVDEFDVTPIVDTNPAADAVDENSPIGTSVGITANSVDADATTSTVTYSLVDSAGGLFQVNPSTGVVTTAALINRESPLIGSYNITVRATSQDTSTTTKSFTIVINDVDEFDATPIVDNNVTADAINENVPIGTTVGITAFSVDSDATTNVITYSLDNSAGGLFQIDPVTGVVSTAALINRESPLIGSYDITIRATSQDGSTEIQTYTIAVNDVDEFDVTPIVDDNLAADAVNENALIGTTVGITARSVDGDATNSTVTYSLVDSAGGLFQIHPVTGVVTTAALINRESPQVGSYNITVRATSADTSTTTKTYTIAIIDVDEFDVGAITDTNAAVNIVPENAAAGTLVGITASATDADSTNNGITYSLWNTHSGRFAIDPATGVMTVENGALLNREAFASWFVTVIATSQDGSKSVKEFVVQISDVSEFKVGAISDVNPAENSIPENCPPGTLVGITASATDLDATNNAITYSLINDRGGRFAIHPTTGVVTANGNLIDREVAGAWAITVLATSQDGSINVKEFIVQIRDVDESNVGLVFDVNPALNTVPENAANGTLVGVTALAVDNDATNSAITYSLIDNAGGRFAIHPVTGVVTVANGSLLDREAAVGWGIMIRATSQDGSYTDRPFSIYLSDVDDLDVGPVNDVNASADSVAENSPAGTPVGLTARAVDGDATNNSVYYSLTDSAGGRFIIHPSSGVVTVAAGAVLDFETASSHQITVLATSSDGSQSSRSFTINVTDVFDVPRVTLSNNSVAENLPIGSVVGTLGTADVNVTSPVFSLVAGSGATDNSKFQITGNQLTTRAKFNRATKSSYSIRVQLRGAGGVVLTQVFTIQVTPGTTFPATTIV